MKALLVLSLMGCLFFAGCSVLDKIAPPQLDANGVAIPGSREATAITKTVAGQIPYGTVALNFLLLAVAGVEKFRAYKMEKGLKATLLAGKQVAADPDLKELWEKVQDSYYRQAHDTAGVTALIKSLLAKLPLVKSV